MHGNETGIMDCTILEKSMESIKEVYEQHKHLDKVLNDPEWCNDDIGYSIAGTLYRAIKKVAEVKKED